MSVDLSQIPSATPYIAIIRIECKSDEAADEVVQLLQKIKTYAAENEPRTLTFRICRFEKTVVIFEEYESVEARNAHGESEVYKHMIDTVPQLAVKPPYREFFLEQK